MYTYGDEEDEGKHRLLRRQLENSPATASPKPKPKPPPKKKNTEAHETHHDKTDGGTTSSGGSGGGSRTSGGSSSGTSVSTSGGGSSSSTGGTSSSSGGSISSSGGGGGSNSGGSSATTQTSDTSSASDSQIRLPKKSSIMHGESKSVLTLLSSAVVVGFIVAGIAFVRQREYVEDSNDQHPGHRLKGSVGKRMNMFSHMIDMQSTVDSSGSQLDNDLSSTTSSNVTKKSFGLGIVKMSKAAKKKLRKTLSRKKSVRQQSIEDDISAYSRSEDSHTTYEGGAVML